MKYLKAAVIIFLLVIIAVTGRYVFYYFKQYNDAQNYYEELENDYVVEEINTTAADVSPDSNEDVTKSSARVRIDVNALKDKYDDACGYLYQKGFISYPVMQADDNDYYLDHNPDGDYSIAGSLFFDKNCSNKTRRLIIYGHNMIDDSMFGALTKFSEKKYGSKHKDFIVCVNDVQYDAQLICASYTTAGSYMYETGFLEENDYLEWVEKIKNGSVYTTDSVVTENDGTLLLSTCTNGDGRFVILLKVTGLYSSIQKNINERTEFLRDE